MIIIVIIIIIIIIIINNIFFPFVWSLHFGGKQWNVGMRQGGELGSLSVWAWPSWRHKERSVQAFVHYAFVLPTPPPPH